MEPPLRYPVALLRGSSFSYYKKENEIFEEVDVVQSVVLVPEGECISSEVLYRNRCKIGYPLPDGLEVRESNL